MNISKPVVRRIDDTVSSLHDFEKELFALPSVEPLSESDIIELRDRFGEDVEFVVRDMLSGKGERWG